MEKIFVPNHIIDLGPVNLVIASLLESTTNVIKLKVYEREYFFENPNPQDNQAQIAQYSVCSNSIAQAITELQNLYAGWSKIDKTQSIKIIGIHNQDPKTLFIQFSLGEQYFIYQRCPKINFESVQEELFGEKTTLHKRSISNDDEQYLISMLRFLPKTKKAISFYPKTSSRFTRSRRHLSLTHSS